MQDKNLLFQQLKSQITPETTQKTGQLSNKYLREILFIERQFKEEGLVESYSQNLHLIDPAKNNDQFATNKFKRSEYELAWEKIEGQFHLTLTNIPYKNKKKLMSCPIEFQKDALEIMPLFTNQLIQSFSQKFEKLVSEIPYDLDDESSNDTEIADPQ